MIAEIATPTLLEDWQTRRRRLGDQVTQPGDRADALAQVFDFLIQRYQESPAATAPARGATPRKTMLNSRAMIVHHHLWSDTVAGVKTPKQAHQRMVDLLRRMETSRHGTGCDEKSAQETFAPYEHEPVQEPPDYARRASRRWLAIVRLAFAFGVGEMDAIRNLLAVWPFLPKYAITHLTAKASLPMSRDLDAVQLLSRCASRCVYTLVAETLAERLEAVGPDEVTEALAALLRRPTVQEEYYPKTVQAARLHVRERLASDDLSTRLRTIGLVAQVGDLQDIGLLADLLAAPEAPESPRERDALLTAMDTISRRSVV